MILLGMGTSADLFIVPLIPLVLLANLMPITIGGYGVRETFAVFLFNLKGIKAPVAAGSVGISTFFDLVIPAFIGVGVYLFQKRSNTARELV